MPIEITDSVRSIIKSKLWRMGKKLAGIGGPSRSKQLLSWKMFEVDTTIVNKQLLKGKRKIET